MHGKTSSTVSTVKEDTSAQRRDDSDTACERHNGTGDIRGLLEEKLTVSEQAVLLGYD